MKSITDKLSLANAILRSEGIVDGIGIVWQKLIFKPLSYFQALRFQNYLKLEQKYIDSLTNNLALLLSQLNNKPTFSVIMPVYNIDEIWLRKAIESVRNQIYPYWELCIADDGSSDVRVKQILKEYSQLDDRIKVVFRDKNGGISAASNSALELANGEYIAFLDHNDELAPHALYENANLINQHPEADYIYSDEDFIDTRQRRYGPLFKPAWSPHLILNYMYTCHLSVYRTVLIREIGGLRSNFDGAQDYDLVLRVTEKTTNIFHIPKILYHWRSIPSSSASGPVKMYAYEAGKRALQEKLIHQPIKGRVDHNISLGWGFYKYEYEIVNNPKVSIIIPSAGKILQGKNISALENCIKSLVSRTSYGNFEIIVVDGYDISETLKLKLTNIAEVKFISCADKFNFSQRINLGAQETSGEHLLLLNDDTEPINSEWLGSMLQLSQLPNTGAVGAKLLFPSRKIQHVGVVIHNSEKLYCDHVYYKHNHLQRGYMNVCNMTRNYIAVTGACLMVKKDLFTEVGGLNEDLPLNYNDVDFCLRLHKAGYFNVYTPYANLYHYESLTRARIVESWEIEYMQAKWAEYMKSLGGYDPYYNPNFSSSSCNFMI
jgi:glycosyltransferase involved in cell wall biosynthesis